MENRPRGREKHVTGPGKGVQKQGEGLGTGPVGRQDGYAGRTGGDGSRGSRGNGGGFNPILLIILAVLLLGGGGISGLFGNLGSLLGGGDIASLPGGTQDMPSYTETLPGEIGTSGDTGSSLDMGSLLESFLGGSSSSVLPSGYSGGSTVSSGWSDASNTGRLDKTVAPGSRAKYTKIRGGGKDTVTIMVYMCGTDLESKSGMGSSDLQEMLNANLSSNVNLLVYTGGCKRWKNNTVSNSVCQIYKVENGNLRCLVKDDGDNTMTDGNTLKRFLTYAKNNYAADRYQLIFWDHGGGSLSAYGYDEKHSSGGSMSLRTINTVLKDSGIKYDFVGFDACLMATLETALMLDDYADYLIASEETEPGVGWYYTTWLNDLSRNTSIPTVELGQSIVDSFISATSKSCPGSKMTLSVVDLAELSATVPAPLKAFAKDTADMIGNDGYQTVSDARASTREFAAAQKIDQVDLVHLAMNLDTDESKALAEALLSAIKYNRTSSNMTNAYGLSIYFPYKKVSKASAAVAIYDAIGMDEEYSRCIQQFASMEASGQAVSGGAASPFSVFSGAGSSAGSTASSGEILDILGSLMGGGTGGLDFGSDFSSLLGRSLDPDKAAEFIGEHQFDPSALKWQTKNGRKVISMSEEQWKLVHDLQLNVFYDDGEGYIDLGLDMVFEFTKDGDLLGEYDGTWLAIDGQPVAFYTVDATYDGDNYCITGRVPVLLNGDRAELIIVFDNDNPYGKIQGARTEYFNGETDTVAKEIVFLTENDTIQAICDYYDYDGVYQDSYRLGDPFKYREDLEISNVEIDRSRCIATYLFTDIYHQEYWTEAIR